MTISRSSFARSSPGIRNSSGSVDGRIGFRDDLGADWLDRLELMIAIEEQVRGLEIADVVTDQIDTVGDLLRIIERKARFEATAWCMDRSSLGWVNGGLKAQTMPHGRALAAEPRFSGRASFSIIRALPGM
jgi:acyl carrier protein